MRNTAESILSDIPEEEEDIEEKIEKMIGDLKGVINPDLRIELAREIKIALNKLEREVGPRGVTDYYERLNRAYGDTIEDIMPPEEEQLSEEEIKEGKRRIAAIATLEDMFDELEAEKDPEAREDLAEEIEEFLNRNEKIILRSDKSGINDLRNFRLSLDNLRPEKEEEAVA